MKSNNKAFTLIELMIVVAILGILAAVAIPAFITYMSRSKSAETSVLLKSLAEAEVSFYNKPRYNAADGSELVRCYLETGALLPDATPGAQKRAWAGAANMDFLGVGSASPVYYSYGVRVIADAPAGAIADYAAYAAGAGRCTLLTDNPAAPAAGTADVLSAGAFGDLDGDRAGAGTVSVYQRNLGVGATAQIPAAQPIISAFELE